MKGLCWLLIVSSCAYGGGPVIGYGQHGWLAGAEAGGGVAVVQTQIGYQSRHDTVYVRADAVYDTVGFDSRAPKAGFTVGGGYARSFDDYASGGVFAVGPRYVREVSHLTCDTNGTYELVSLQLRYITEWQLVLAPRIERRITACLGD